MTFIESFKAALKDTTAIGSRPDLVWLGKISGKFLKAAVETTLTVGAASQALRAPTIGKKLMWAGIAAYSAARTTRSYGRTAKSIIVAPKNVG